MKRTTAHVTTIFAALFLLATATSVQAAACSNATRKGNYAALLTGVSGGLPFAALDHVTADGLGNLTGTGTVNVNGTVSSGAWCYVFVRGHGRGQRSHHQQLLPAAPAPGVPAYPP